jgi:NAD(P)-dependent dehydrogenase (short-subunit alcohol dehydrogenase family)
MNKTVFITGNSSGIGNGLTKETLRRNWSVYGLSRRGIESLSGDIHDVLCDLGNHTEIVPALEVLFGDLKHLNLVFLNAGVFGEIRNISQTSVESIKNVMDINVWANKIILDWFFNNGIHIEQIVAISSGVAIKGYKGWVEYSLSKALFKDMIELYANQFPDTHFISLAPGLVDTPMQDYICNESIVSVDEFPSVQKFRDARGTEKMSDPGEVAISILDLLPKLLTFPSGSFVDKRKI